MEPVRASYIWVSGHDTYHDIRGKDRTIYFSKDEIAAITEKRSKMIHLFPEWNFDGSSTCQSKGLNTEIVIKPVTVFPFPIPSVSFPGILRFVVLCECYYEGNPTKCNTRYIANRIFEGERAKTLMPWYGLEQEYIILKDGRPLGWPDHGFPAPQGPYYCGIGADRAFGRKIVDRHYELCLAMGLKMSGINGEVTPGQWEYQIGPCEGIEAGDHLIVARWLYAIILEEFSVTDKCTYTLEYEPAPIKGDWNGSGMHTNFSTIETRDMEDGKGLKAIMTYIDRLSKTMKNDITFYGKNNVQRLNGKHETSKIDEFSFGIGTRTTSIRIPNQVQSQGYGYLEDRRPAGNADPYLVTVNLFSSATGTKN